MIKTYPYPEGLEFNKEYKVILKDTVTGKEFEPICYNALVCNTCIEDGKAHNAPESLHRDNMAFLMFESDFSAPIEVTVTNVVTQAKSVQIRPLSYNMDFKKENNTVKFIIDKPTKLSIEFDNDIYHNLFLYAELPETEKPNINNSNVIYFPPGIHDAGEIVLKDNAILYLSEGSFVYGRITAKNANNITICGRGILSGKKMIHDMQAERPPLMNIANCNNIIVRDVILLDGSGWTSAFFHCNDVHINNLKQITNYYNSDGFDICSCTDFLVENVFVRNFDDSVSIKSHGGDCRNIIVRNSVLWNDCAHSILVGPESPPEAKSIFEDILFENIIVLDSQEHNPTFMGVMAMMCTDNATFRNITWRNIEVERIDYGKLIFACFQTAYGTQIGKSIENILIENVHYSGPLTSKSKIFGADSEHTIKDFKIHNLFINGRLQDEATAFIETNEFADVKIS